MSSAPAWIRASAGGCVLEIRVIPRARRSVLAGERDGRLLVRLSAPPVDGAANAALVEVLSDVLDVPRRSITIVGGQTSREKRVAVSGVEVAGALAKIAKIAKS